MIEASCAAPSYAFRSLLFRRERRFELMPKALLVENGSSRVEIPYGDIATVRLYQVDISDIGPVDRCDLRTPRGAIRLQSAHVMGPARLEDRRATYEPFVWGLLQHVYDANPNVRIVAGLPGSTRLGWIFALVVLVIAALGGAALMATGSWDGLWLTAMALGAAPRVLAMLTKKPSRLINMSHIVASRTDCDRRSE